MKPVAWILPAVLFLSLGAAGCAKKQESSWRIIEEGDRNPNITYAPARAGETRRR